MKKPGLIRLALMAVLVAIGGLLLTSDRSPTQAVVLASSVSEDDPTVYVTKTGDHYHRDSCKSLAESKIAMKLSKAKLRYKACSKCNPPK